MSVDLLFLLTAGVLGLLMGSFGNAAIHRIPREIPLGLFASHRSVCPKCGTQIKIWHNIPVFSYFWLKGRCAACAWKIPLRYPIVEILTLLLFYVAALLFLRFHGFSWGYDALGWELAYFGVQLYFLWSLLVVTFIDIDFRIIPDRFSLGNWGVAIVASLIFGEPHIFEALIGGAFGFGMFYLLAWGYEKYKGVEGLGFGDVKMMGWLGTWLGMEWVPIIIFLGSLSGLFLGLIVARKEGKGLQTALPFGPFLAWAAFVAWILKMSDFSTQNFVF